jgi:hypothetical protein
MASEKCILTLQYAGEESTMSLDPRLSHDLAERIGAAVLESRRSDEIGSSFIRPWRLNANHARRETYEVISCSECGCGISPDLK